MRPLIERFSSRLRRGSTATFGDPFVPDLNLLPEEWQGRRLTQEERRLTFAAILLVVLAVVQFQFIGASAIATGQALLPGGLQGNDPLTIQTERLERFIQQAQDEIREGELVGSEILQIKIPWGNLMTYIYDEAPADVTVNSLRGTGVQATLTGSAGSSGSASMYRQILSESSSVFKVDLQSISRDPSTSRFNFTFEIGLEPGT